MKLLVLALTLSMYYGSVQQGHGSKGRIGILYDPVHHRIVKVYKGTPAYEVGLRVGDIVKHVNAADITGPSYTYVNLTIQRNGKLLTFEVERIPREYVNDHKENEYHPEKEIDPKVDLKTANSLFSWTDDRIT